MRANFCVVFRSQYFFSRYKYYQTFIRNNILILQQCHRGENDREIALRERREITEELYNEMKLKELASVKNGTLVKINS